MNKENIKNRERVSTGREIVKRLGISGRSFLKMLAYFGFLILLYILQAMVFPYLTIFGVKPLILPVAVMCASLFDGSVRGGVFGLGAGMLCDLSFNQPAIQFTLLLTVLGLTAGYLFNTVMSTGFPAFLICTAAALFICAMVQAFPIMVYQGAEFLPVLRVTAIQTLYSSVFTVPLYYTVRSISRISRF